MARCYKIGHMKRVIDSLIVIAAVASGLYFFFVAGRAVGVVQAQSQLRGKASMRGAAIFGLNGCNPFVMVCQGTPVTVTAANLINGDSVQVIPAQGANTFIMLVGFSLQYVPGSIPFSNDFTADTLYGGTNFGACQALRVLTSGTVAGLSGGTCVADAVQVPANLGLDVTNDFGPVTGGNGSVIVTPIYTVVTTQ